MAAIVLKSMATLVTLTISTDMLGTNQLNCGCKRSVSIETVNYPGRFWRHCNGLGFIDDNNQNNSACDPNVFLGDITFIMREPGLTGENGTVSFESANYPNHFLKHQDKRMGIDLRNAARKFSQDATFRRLVPGKFNSNDIRHHDNSFESVNNPGFFIRHCSNELYIDNNSVNNDRCDPNNDVYLMDITFHVVDGRTLMDSCCSHFKIVPP